MTAYLLKVKEALQSFPRYVLTHIDREANVHADALEKLATSRGADLLGLVPVEVLSDSSNVEQPRVCAVEPRPSWMDEFIANLQEDRLPEDKHEARRVKYHAEHYLLLGDRLYKRVSTPLL